MRLKRHLLPAALLAVVAIALIIVPDVLAQNFGLDKAVAGTGIPKGASIPSIIASLLRAALGFVGTLFLLLMIYAGFLYMTARGDSKKIDQAKQLITGAIIGVVLIAGAYAITGFVITAVTNTSAGESSGADLPAEQCVDKSCSTALDCQGVACFTGTCFCTSGGEEHPASGKMLGTSANPCTAGSCGKTQ